MALIKIFLLIILNLLFIILLILILIYLILNLIIKILYFIYLSNFKNNLNIFCFKSPIFVIFFIFIIIDYILPII